MGKLEKIGNLFRKLGGRKKKDKKNRRDEESSQPSSEDDNTTSSSSAFRRGQPPLRRWTPNPRLEVPMTRGDDFDHFYVDSSRSSFNNSQLTTLTHLDQLGAKLQPLAEKEFGDSASVTVSFSVPAKPARSPARSPALTRSHSPAKLSDTEEAHSGYGTDTSQLPQMERRRYQSSDFDKESLDTGYQSNLELSPRDGFLSSPDSARTPSSKRLSPRIGYTQKSLDNLLIKERRRPSELQRPLSTFEDILTKRDSIGSFLKSNVYKSKYITCVFEATNGGMNELVDDVIHELDRWFTQKNMLAVACELHYSEPEKHRSRTHELRLKDRTLNLLRENNLRILHMKGVRGATALQMAESQTQEHITRDNELKATQGFYQRSYNRLLPFVHSDTPVWHSPYWQLNDHAAGTPRPEAFLFGADRSKLTNTTVIAVNVVGLSIAGNERHRWSDIMI